MNIMLDRIIEKELEFAAEVSESPDCRPRKWKCRSPYWVLHKFPAHRTELQKFHREELFSIADTIAKSFEGNRPIRCVRLIGHAATWKYISNSEYCRRSLARAQTAAELLSSQLSTFGLAAKIFHESDDLNLEDSGDCCKPVSGVNVTLFVGGRADTEALVDNLTKRSDKSARDNRALNRRVEIFLVRSKPKKCDSQDLQLAKALENMPIEGLSQSREEQAAIECLRDMLVAALRDCKRIDDTYLMTAADVPMNPLQNDMIFFYKEHLIKRLKEWCSKGKRGKKLARCFKQFHDDILNTFYVLMKVLQRYQAHWRERPSVISKRKECQHARFLMKQAKNKNSIYYCYRENIRRINFDILCCSPTSKCNFSR